DITLTVEGLPKGVTCPPQVMGGGVRKLQLVLTGAMDAPAWAGEIKVKGTATIGGKPVVREARPGGIVWQGQPGQNVPMVARLGQAWPRPGRATPPTRRPPPLDKPQALQGDRVVLTVKVDRLWADMRAPIQITANQNQGGGQLPLLPQGLQIQQTNIAPAQNE